jgi:hypothetical protein
MGSLRLLLIAADASNIIFHLSERGVDALLMLRSKGMITKAEFEQMRRRIINDLGLQL